MKMRKKWGALLLAPALAGSLLAGCSNAGNEMPLGAAVQATEAPAEEDVTVRIGQIQSLADGMLTVYLSDDVMSAEGESAGKNEESGESTNNADDSGAANATDGTGSAASDAEESNSVADDAAVDGSTADDAVANGSAAEASAVEGAAQGFAAETIDIVVTDATLLTKSGADGADEGDNGANSTGDAASGGRPIDRTSFDGDAIALTDLDPGDFIAYTLLSGSNEAARIALLPGNPYAASPTGDGTNKPGPEDGSAPTAAPAASGAPAQGDAKPGGGAKGGNAPQASGAPSSDKPSGTKPAQGQSAGAKPAAGTDAAAPAGRRDTAAKASSSPATGASASASTSGSTSAPAGGSGTSPASGQLTIGKIKSVSGSTITIYKASMAPGSGGNASSRGTPPSGEGGATPPASTEPAASARPSGEAGGSSGGGPGGGRMAQTFTDETMEIEVTDATSIVTVTMANGERSETAISLSSLKEGDIVMIQLKDDTSQAVSIRLNDGGGAPASAGE